jgi:hypothetical protein
LRESNEIAASSVMPADLGLDEPVPQGFNITYPFGLEFPTVPFNLDVLGASP